MPLLQKLATAGLASLAILHPTSRQYIDIRSWEEERFEQYEEAMCTKSYQNGVLFGLWAAGVAVSVGKLITYVFWGSRRGIHDRETQTEDKDEKKLEQNEIKEDIQDNQQIEKLELQQGDIMENGDKVEKSPILDHGDSFTPAVSPKIELEMSSSSSTSLSSSTTYDVVLKDKDCDEDGSEVGAVAGTLTEGGDKVSGDDIRISVYKLPAIKKHHFLIRQDGMRALRDSVEGKFSLDRVQLDGIRNFLFIVAKGTPAQLNELETKIRTDFRWLTPVKEPSSKLTKGMTVQEPQIPASALPILQASRTPNASSPTKATSPTKQPSATKLPSPRIGVTTRSHSVKSNK